MTDDSRANDPARRVWWLWPLALVLLPVALVLIILWFVWAGALLLVAWVAWCPRRRFALVVYSNSPIWQEYFEARVLPAIGRRAVVLNWSERKRWDYSLAVALFRCFGGTREFNPIAIGVRTPHLAAPIPFLPRVPRVQARTPG